MARPKRPRDTNQLAKFVTDVATGEVEDSIDDGRNELATEFARKGGLKGGKARAEKLSPERQREIAKKAASTRWSRVSQTTRETIE